MIHLRRLRSARGLISVLVVGLLLIPVSVTRAATDAPTAYRFLDDLNPAGDSSPAQTGQVGGELYEPGVHSGDKYFVVVDDTNSGQEFFHLYVTDGTGEGSLVDVAEVSGGASCRSGYRPRLTAFGEGFVLFLGANGDEEEWDSPPPCREWRPRLFVSDGTDAGTAPLLPVDDPDFPCDGDDPACGFYRIATENNAIGTPPMDVTSSSGVVFIGAWFDGADFGPRLPYRITGDATSFQVDAIDPDSGLTGGAPLLNSLCCPPDQAGEMLVAVGDVVFADLTDCADAGCDLEGGDEGRELYAADLSDPSPTWHLADLTKPTPAGSSQVGQIAGVRPYGVVDGHLYFRASNYVFASSGQYGTYVATYLPGTSGNPDTLHVEKVGLEARYSATLGSAFYFWTFLNAYNTSGTRLVRATSDAGGSPTVEQIVAYPNQTFNAGGYSLWSTGSALYFFGSSIPTATLVDGLFRLALGGQSPTKIFDADPDTDLRPYWVTPVDGNLYFLFPPFGGDVPSEMYADSGSGTPSIVTRINAGTGARWGGITQADDLILLWADDGVHGIEPWAGKVLGAPLTVAVVGPGTLSEGTGVLEECADICSASIRFGSTVTLGASESGGSDFLGWTSTCAPDPDDPFSCAVVMDGPKSVVAIFREAGDVLGVTATASPEVDPTGTIEYTVVVGNVTDAAVAPVTLDVVLTGDPATVDQARTPWCAPAGSATVSCTIPSIPARSAKVLKVFATAPVGGAVDAAFSVSSGNTDLISSNDGASVSVGQSGILAMTATSRVSDGRSFLGPLVETPDRFSIDVAAYPSQTVSGGQLPYSVAVRNAGASSGAVLHVGFAAATATRIGARGYACTLDSAPASGFLVSVACPISIPAGGTKVIPVSAIAPITTDGDIGVSATFWVTYAGGADGDPSTDRTEAFGTTIADSTSDVRHSTQIPLPLGAQIRYSTMRSSGVTPLDPTAVDVTVPARFAGYVSSGELTETEGTFAPSLTTPSVLRCIDARIYAAGCLAFEVSMEPFVASIRTIEIAFSVDSSALVSVLTGRQLPLTKTFLFASTDGGDEYVRVLGCPAGASLTTYAGSAPCLTRKVKRSSGDVVLTVLTPVGGLWKLGAG